MDVNVLPEIVLTLEPGDHIYTILTANGTEECQINIAVICKFLCYIFLSYPVTS